MNNNEDIEDIAEDNVQLGNYHIEVPEGMEYMVDQFSTFATKDKNGEPSEWKISPKIVKDWMVRFGQIKFKEGQDEAFSRVIELIGPNMNEETRKGLMFLINEK